MIVIGLTGGIGSGKTTVSSLFREQGATIIDCDVIAQELVKFGTPALESITEHFGIGVLNPDKSLNRKKLREIIFKDHSERKWLQDLLHPLIVQEIKNRVDEVQTSYAIAVIPLLVEVGISGVIHRILVVDSPEELQIQRTMIRDNCTERQVKKIMNTQATRQQRLSKADDIIINDGNLASLRRQVEKLHQYYLSLSDE